MAKGQSSKEGIDTRVVVILALVMVGMITQHQRRANKMGLEIIASFFLMVASWAAHRGDYGLSVWFFGVFLMFLTPP
jgi:hypothetical protein